MQYKLLGKFTLLCSYLVDALLESQPMIRYKPGDWIEGVGGAKAGHFVLPEITTLLLVGPRGSGKSTLVNRITRVFDKDDVPFAPDRAQVSRKFYPSLRMLFRGAVQLKLISSITVQ